MTDLRAEALTYHKYLLPRLPTLREKIDQPVLLSERNVKQWGIGLCPPSAACSFSGWRARLIVPIINEVGTFVALAGRKLLPTDTSGKWVNNPFEKRRVLFGLNRAWPHIVSARSAILVEGYSDVIALHDAGEKRAVACMGNTASRQQLTLLLRYCTKLFIIPDQDKNGSGMEGANKTVTLAKAVGMAAELIYTPAYYEDPAVLATKHRELLDELLKDAH